MASSRLHAIPSGMRTSTSSSSQPRAARARNLSRDSERQQKFPDWSPDGRWLAVDEEGAVVFVATDGSARIARPDGLIGNFPAWAPG